MIHCKLYTYFGICTAIARAIAQQFSALYNIFGISSLKILATLLWGTENSKVLNMFLSRFEASIFSALMKVFVSFGHDESVKQPICITSEYRLLKTGLDRSSKKSYHRVHFRFLLVYILLINLCNKFCFQEQSRLDLFYLRVIVCVCSVYVCICSVCVCVANTIRWIQQTVA